MKFKLGIGRTGKPFAFQHYGLQPDIVSVAKGLGNGLPIGAIIGKAHLKDVFGPGSHGTTFGGNPIAIAAANATMDTIFDTSFLNDLNEKADFFKRILEENLLEIPIVKEIRGLGFMIGIEVNIPVPAILASMRSNWFYCTFSRGKCHSVIATINRKQRRIATWHWTLLLLH